MGIPPHDLGTRLFVVEDVASDQLFRQRHLQEHPGRQLGCEGDFLARFGGPIAIADHDIPPTVARRNAHRRILVLGRKRGVPVETRLFDVHTVRIASPIDKNPALDVDAVAACQPADDVVEREGGRCGSKHQPPGRYCQQAGGCETRCPPGSRSHALPDGPLHSMRFGTGGDRRKPRQQVAAQRIVLPVELAVRKSQPIISVSVLAHGIRASLRASARLRRSRARSSTR